jgi:hypothetical protein
VHQRLVNEFLLRLARRALQIIAPCLREEEYRDAFDEFFAAFKEELLWFEHESERIQARLAGARRKRRDRNGKPTSEIDQGQAEDEPSGEVAGHDH